MFSEFKPVKSNIELSIDEIEHLLFEVIKFGFLNVGNFTRNISLTFVVDMNRNELHFMLSKSKGNGCLEEERYDSLILNYEEETYRFLSGGLTKLLSIKALKRLFRLHKSRGTSLGNKWNFRHEKIICRVIADINGLNSVGADSRLLEQDVEFVHNFNDGYCCVFMLVNNWFGSKLIKQDVPKYWIKFLN